MVVTVQYDSFPITIIIGAPGPAPVTCSCHGNKIKSVSQIGGGVKVVRGMTLLQEISGGVDSFCY